MQLVNLHSSIRALECVKARADLTFHFNFESRLKIPFHSILYPFSLLVTDRYAVWILGSAHTLKIHSKVWRDLIIDAKRTNSFIDATGDGGMSKVIQKFRSEYRPKSEPDCQGQGYMEIKSIRSIEALPTMMEVPRRNEWESIEQCEVRQMQNNNFFQ